MQAGSGWKVEWAGFGSEECRIEFGCAGLCLRARRFANHCSELVEGNERAMRRNEPCCSLLVQRVNGGATGIARGDLAGRRHLERVFGQPSYRSEEHTSELQSL